MDSGRPRTMLPAGASSIGRAIVLSCAIGCAHADDPSGVDATPPVPSATLECPAGIVVRAARALHFAGDESLWEGQYRNACRLDPAHRDHAIVALTYVAGEEKTGEPDESGTSSARDLDIVIMRTSDGSIVARGHWDLDIQDDAYRLESVAIDTGRYILGHDKRAFGIRTANATHCTCTNNGWSGLTLFVENEDRIDAILRTHASRWQDESDGLDEPRPPCSLSSTEWHSTLVVGQPGHHGLADLDEVSVEQAKYESDEAAAHCPALPPKKTVTTWRFDGHVYQALEPARSR